MTLSESFESLDDWMTGEPDHDGPIDADLADRLLRVLRRLDRETSADLDVASAEHERINAWIDGREQARTDRRDQITATLRRFHEAALTVDPRRKTISLPNGTLKARQGQARWTFSDAFLPWAREHLAAAVRVTESVDKREARRLLTEAGTTPDGEVVPGVEIEPAEVGYSVTLGDDSE